MLTIILYAEWFDLTLVQNPIHARFGDSEMKYSVNKFGIDKGYDEDLRNKIDSFVRATDCKKTVQLVMVTTYGLKPSKYNSLVNVEVELDDLFYPA